MKILCPAALQQCIHMLKLHHILYVPDVSYGTLSDMEVAEDSNGICNEECEYPLSEEELDSDSGNTSDDFFAYQKSQNSYSAVTENSASPSCSSSLSQIVSIVPPNGTLLFTGYIKVLSSHLAKFNFRFYEFQKPGI